MTEPNKIFVILDPTTMNQPSLVMAETIAQDILSGGSREVSLHIYCCIAEDTVRMPAGIDPEQAREEELARVSNWVDRLAQHSRSLGLKADTEVEIHPRWRRAIVAAVARQPSTVAVKNMTEQTRLTRLVRDTSDWKLLRDTGCPLFLVKSYARRHIRKVLVAIKHSAEGTVYSSVNDRLLETGRQIAENVGAELHVVTAYKDVDDYPDRQKFADRCGVSRNQVTAVMAKPTEAITTAAKETDADLVVIARVGKPGGKKKVGRTAENVIDNLYCNILVLPMADED